MFIHTAISFLQVECLIQLSNHYTADRRWLRSAPQKVVAEICGRRLRPAFSNTDI